MALVGAYVGLLKTSFKETVITLEKKIDELTKALGGLMTEKMCGLYHTGHTAIHDNFEKEIAAVREQIKHTEGSVAVVASRVTRAEIDLNGVGRKASGLEEKYGELQRRTEKIEG